MALSRTIGNNARLALSSGGLLQFAQISWRLSLGPGRCFWCCWTSSSRSGACSPWRFRRKRERLRISSSLRRHGVGSRSEAIQNLGWPGSSASIWFACNDLAFCILADCWKSCKIQGHSFSSPTFQMALGSNWREVALMVEYDEQRSLLLGHCLCLVSDDPKSLPKRLGYFDCFYYSFKFLILLKI